MLSLHSYSLDWSEISVMENIENWIKKKGNPLHLPFFVIRHIWKTRNLSIFEGKKPIVDNIYHIIMHNVHEYPISYTRRSSKINMGSPPIFDGAATGDNGGAGIFLLINQSHHYHIKVGCGSSTNTRVEPLAL